MELDTAVGVTASAHNGGKGHGKGGDMCYSIEILGAFSVSDPKPFLPCSIKAGIIAFALRFERIDAFKTQALPVNEASVIIRNCLIFCASAIPFAVVPVLVIAWTATVL